MNILREWIFSMPVAVLCAGFISCDRLTIKEVPEERIVAKAGDEILSLSEYTNTFLDAGSTGDSASGARRSIENWARESLFLQEALYNIL